MCCSSEGRTYGPSGQICGIPVTPSSTPFGMSVSMAEVINTGAKYCQDVCRGLDCRGCMLQQTADPETDELLVGMLHMKMCC